MATAVAVYLALYSSILVKLAYDWWTLPDFSHAIFVPIFSAFVVWRRRLALSLVPLQPSWSGIGVFSAGLVMFIIGQLGAELFVSRASLLVGISGLVLLFLGRKMMRALLFPWAILLLMIPIPELLFGQITFPLQLLSSQLASMVLPLLNVPVFREGNVIHVPAMPLQVAEACSGIRSLITLSTLTIIYSYIAEPVSWRRVVLVAASIPIAVAANSVRVIGTGVCVHYLSPDLALGFFHEFSGVVIFVVSMIMLYGVHLLIRRNGRSSA